jgi:hypothetical protein
LDENDVPDLRVCDEGRREEKSAIVFEETHRSPKRERTEDEVRKTTAYLKDIGIVHVDEVSGVATADTVVVDLRARTARTSSSHLC